jgi:hypothetical protein
MLAYRAKSGETFSANKRFNGVNSLEEYHDPKVNFFSDENGSSGITYQSTRDYLYTVPQ